MLAPGKSSQPHNLNFPKALIGPADSHETHPRRALRFKVEKGGRIGRHGLMCPTECPLAAQLGNQRPFPTGGHSIE